MKIKSDDGRIIHFETFGDPKNTPVLLIHGLGAEMASWKYQIEEFPRNGYFAIAMDMYGHGDSGDLKEGRLEEWNSQIVCLLDHLNIEQAVICGYSMGGVIAQHFTITHRNRIQALIVSDSFGELKTPLEKLLGFSQIIGFRIFRLLGRKIFAGAMASAYKEEFASEVRAYMHKRSLSADFSQLLKARRAINRIDALNRLGDAKVPALITVGTSFGQLFININRKIAHAIPRSRFAVITESMDPSPMVNPEAFNREALLFLNELAMSDDSESRLTDQKLQDD